MNKKLRRIRSPLRRFVLSCYLSWLIFAGCFQSPRVRIHWIGRPRPRRPERVQIVMAFAVFMLAAAAVLDYRQFLIWSIAWGALFAFTLNAYAVYRLVPFKKRKGL